MILGGKLIRQYNIITPFMERTHEFGMTYGVGPASYDIRIKQTLNLKPKEFSLASTIEYFKMPKDICGQVLDKSSWARKGLSLFNTWLDNGWIGFLTLELVNNSNDTLIIESGSPIAQVVFQRVEDAEDVYQGKYQHQGNIPVSSVYENGAWGEALKRTDFGDEKLSIKQVETRRQLEASILNYGKRSSYEYPD